MSVEGATARETLAERYLLTDVVRSGAQARVVKALDLVTSGFVAVKRVLFGPDDERAREGFRREANTLQALEHPNIVRVVTVDQDGDGNWYLVLEWIEDNLEDVIARDGPMPWTLFWDRIGAPLIDAIAYGQKRNIAHRDIKPKNVLVDSGGTPKLADYGIAKLVDNGGTWKPVVGHTFRFDHTPGYTPDRPDEDQYLFSRDCFAFAAVAASCVAGRTIVDHEDIATILQEATLPEAVKGILEKCLSENPHDRPRLASLLKEQLEQANAELEERSGQAVPIHMVLTAQIQGALERRLGVVGQPALERFLHGELDEVFSVLPEEDGTEDRAEIVGATWKFDAVVAGRHGEILHLPKAWKSVQAAPPSGATEARW